MPTNEYYKYLDVIRRAVEKIRLRGLIVSIAETGLNSGLYLCELSDYHGVEIGRYVTLGVAGLESARIEEIPGDGQMIVSGEKGVDISNVEKYVRLDPYYYEDRRKKIISALLHKNNEYFHDKKFPSVELVLDENSFDDTSENFSAWENIKIVFCESTNQNFTAAERDADNFTNVLRPNYAYFLEALRLDNTVLKENWNVGRKEYFGEIYNERDNKNAKPFYVDAILLTIKNLKILNNSNICEIINKDF